MTFLPKEVVPELQRQIAWATQRHLQHLEEGNDNVSLPFVSLERLRLLTSSATSVYCSDGVKRLA